MTSSKEAAGTFVGAQPWLPWPLSASAWWNNPVRAERLAALRIGLAGCLLLDILLSYWPRLHDLFGPNSLGSLELTAWYADAPRWSWSIFRGFAHPLTAMLALAAWGCTSVLIGIAACVAGVEPSLPHQEVQRQAPDSSVPRVAWLVWIAAGSVYLLGLWGRDIAGGRTGVSWLAPGAGLAGAVLFLILEAVRNGRRPSATSTAAIIVAALWAGVGLWLAARDNITPAGWLADLLFVPWGRQPAALTAAAAVWALSAACLLVGYWTRTAAVFAWVLSTSFANINPDIDNAGDTVRGIILFYLMLTPCGAVWSLDRVLERRRGLRPGPIWISPWALRLLFIQMILIYFCNGIYKLTGADWRSGDSLHYVLADVTLARFSASQFSLPTWLSRGLTWAVLVWEVGFPMWMLARHTRVAALAFGVVFHLAILATMELGSFVPYMLTLYVPLVPWQRGRRGLEPR